MDIAMTVLYQAIVMFIMIIVGYVCYRIHIISQTTNLQLSNLLLLVVNPFIIFISFQTELEARVVSGLLTTFVLSAVSILLMMVITRIVLKKSPEMKYKVDRLACIYTNCGFLERRWSMPCLGTKAFCILPLTLPFPIYLCGRRALGFSPVK